MDLSTLLGPTIFLGGKAVDYAVVLLSNGGFGTKHLPTGRIVPHVLSKADPEILARSLPGTGSGGPLSTFGGALGAAQPWLVAANLGVGLLNLGVGAWTAWKVSGLDRKIDGLAEQGAATDRRLERVGELLGASVVHFDGLIRKNALMLGLMIEHQGNLAEGLVALQRQVAAGFASVHDALNSAEAKRQGQELEQQMRALFTYYQRCSREMQAGRTPPRSDLRRIVDVSVSLSAWVETRLAALIPGEPSRLPLFVARAFALRMEFEARLLLDDAPWGQDDEVAKFLVSVRREVEVVMAGSPPVPLATESRELIEHYVFLHRALRAPATVVQFDDGRALPMFPDAALTWDDGLGAVRDLVGMRQSSPAVAPMELRTLPEHRAWESLSGFRRPDDQVDLSELKAALGLPAEAPLAEDTLRKLLTTVPGAVRDARARVQREVT